MHVRREWNTETETERETKAKAEREILTLSAVFVCLSDLDPLEPRNFVFSTNEAQFKTPPTVRPEQTHSISKDGLRTCDYTDMRTEHLLKNCWIAERNKASTFFADALEVSPLKERHCPHSPISLSLCYYCTSWAERRLTPQVLEEPELIYGNVYIDRMHIFHSNEGWVYSALLIHCD